MKLIQTYLNDLLNGEGLRNVYFFAGCELHCSHCFSPEIWKPSISLIGFKISSLGILRKYIRGDYYRY